MVGIIPTAIEESHIKAPIKALWEYDEDNLIEEIIVADDASTDNTESQSKTKGYICYKSKKEEQCK